MTDPLQLTSFTDDVSLLDHVPEAMRAHYAVQGGEFAARELAREGFSHHAISKALNVEIQIVRKLIGAEL